jgi:hypothetical protein
LRCGGGGYRGRDAGCEIVCELVAKNLELAEFELAHLEAAPVFGGTYQRRIHQLEDGTLAECVRDDFDAPTPLPEQSFEEVGGSDRAAMRQRKSQMRDARLEVVTEEAYR